MKNRFLLFIIFFFAAAAAGAQTLNRIQADSIKLYQVGGSAELIIENSTRGKTNAFLRNKGNGRTEFAFALDSVWQEGSQIRFRRGSETLIFNINSTSRPVYTEYFTGTSANSYTLFNTPAFATITVYINGHKVPAIFLELSVNTIQINAAQLGYSSDTNDIVEIIYQPS